jgi:hypothetical protein
VLSTVVAALPAVGEASEQWLERQSRAGSPDAAAQRTYLDAAANSCEVALGYYQVLEYQVGVGR